MNARVPAPRIAGPNRLAGNIAASQPPTG